jgi:hypothetical protein
LRLHWHMLYLSCSFALFITWLTSWRRENYMTKQLFSVPRSLKMSFITALFCSSEIISYFQHKYIIPSNSYFTSFIAHLNHSTWHFLYSTIQLLTCQHELHDTSLGATGNCRKNYADSPAAVFSFVLSTGYHYVYLYCLIYCCWTALFSSLNHMWNVVPIESVRHKFPTNSLKHWASMNSLRKSDPLGHFWTSILLENTVFPKKN